MDRMRWMRMVAVSLTVVALLAGCTDGGSSPQATQPAGESIPWVQITPGSDQSDTPPPERRCKSTDLKIEAFGSPGVAAGTEYVSATIRNVSATYCAVGRTESVRFLDASGDEVQSSEPMGVDPGPWVVIPTEDDLRDGVHGAYQTIVRLGIPSACPPVRASKLEIRFSGNASHIAVELPANSGSDTPSPDCGERPRYFATFVSEGPAPESPPSPLRAAIVTIDKPEPGNVFRYWVRLTNPSETEATLDPCPTYSQSWKGSQAIEFYVLNCTDRNVIPAGVTVTYEMRVRVPSDVEPLVLTWSIADGSGPTATVVLEPA